VSDIAWILAKPGKKPDVALPLATKARSKG
jgi:hypothetical protein